MTNVTRQSPALRLCSKLYLPKYWFPCVSDMDLEGVRKFESQLQEETNQRVLVGVDLEDSTEQATAH